MLNHECVGEHAALLHLLEDVEAQCRLPNSLQADRKSPNGEKGKITHFAQLPGSCSGPRTNESFDSNLEFTCMAEAIQKDLIPLLLEGQVL